MKKIFVAALLSFIVALSQIAAGRTTGFSVSGIAAFQQKTTSKSTQKKSTQDPKKGTGTQTQKTGTTGQKSKQQTTDKKSGTDKPAQKPGDLTPHEGMIAADKIDTFKLQVIPLVKFFESSLNFLADKRNPVNEKSTIISQSYLKWCWDPEVQVEDDLDENRLVPLHKDMPAYLSDVDFFFRGARFTYTVQDVSVERNQGGMVFFKVTANRALRGLLVSGDSVNSNKVRYIEINFDSVKQQLKIVSIYTTKLNEKDEMRNWWNGLSAAWKTALAMGKEVGGQPIGNIENYNDTVAVIGGQPVEIDNAAFYKALGEIIHAETINLAGNAAITGLEPLNGMSDLKSVDVSGTTVSDLMPLRNLNQLTNLNISGTLVESLEPLKYCTKIQKIRFKNTPVADLGVIPSFQSLNDIDMGSTKVTSLEPLNGMSTIRTLLANGTGISDIKTLETLTALEILDISGTQVTSLSPLKNITTLKELHCDNTKVKDLLPLDGMTSLTAVYCNGSQVDQQEALRFLKKHPETSLVYATTALNDWWKGMSQEWKNTFNLYMELSDPPTSEQLHRLILIDSVNITGRMGIDNLEPVRKLILLRSLQAQSTGITSIEPLSGLKGLKQLNLANTKVAALAPLSTCQNLETVNLENSQVADVSPLTALPRLSLILADNTPLTDPDALKFQDEKPACMLIYQTYENTAWWQSLDQAWRALLLKHTDGKGDPDKIMLERIASLDSVGIIENPQIASLQPLGHLKRMTTLHFSGTAVASLSPVSGFKRLKVLRCLKNPVNDLTPVNALAYLTELDFSNTQVEDLEAIQNMVQLKVLKFSGTQVKNLKYLQKLTNLKVLEFYNTRVTSIDVLEGMRRLTSVKMFNTKVSAKKVDKFKLSHPDCEVVYY